MVLTRAPDSKAMLSNGPFSLSLHFFWSVSFLTAAYIDVQYASFRDFITCAETGAAYLTGSAGTEDLDQALLE